MWLWSCSYLRDNYLRGITTLYLPNVPRAQLAEFAYIIQKCEPVLTLRQRCLWSLINILTLLLHSLIFLSEYLHLSQIVFANDYIQAHILNNLIKTYADYSKSLKYFQNSRLSCVHWHADWTSQFNKNKIYWLVKKWRPELFSGINVAVRFILGPTWARNIPEGKNILHFFVQSARLQRHVFLSFLSISFCSFPCAREITLTRHTQLPFHAMQIKHVHVTPRDQQSEAVHENFFVLLSCTSQVPHFLSCLPLMKLHGRRDIQRQSRCSGSIMCRAARPVSSVASSDNYQDLAIEIVFLKDWRVLAELKKNQSFLCCLGKKKWKWKDKG